MLSLGASSHHAAPPKEEAEARLLLLRWLRRGGRFHDFILAYGVSKACFYHIAWRVCRALCATHVLPMAEAEDEPEKKEEDRVLADALLPVVRIAAAGDGVGQGPL